MTRCGWREYVCLWVTKEEDLRECTSSYIETAGFRSDGTREREGSGPLFRLVWMHIARF